jgi:hypothetical protein
MKRKILFPISIVGKRNSNRQVSDLRIRGEFDVTTLDEEKRTVDVVFATDTPVLTRNFRVSDDPFYEVLSMEPTSIRKERMNVGLPLFKDHWTNIDNQMGIVENFRFENGKIISTVRFSSGKEASDLMADVKDKIKKNVSAGYKVYRYVEMPSTETDTNITYRAEDWEPMELSFVGINADVNSSVRTDGAEEYSVQIQNKTNPKPNNHLMKKEQIIAMLTKRGITLTGTETDEQLVEMLQRQMEVPAPAPAPAPAAEETNQRSSAITTAVRAANLEDSFALELINGTLSIDQARAVVLDKLAKNQPTPNSQHNASVGQERERQLIIEASEAAIVSRTQADLVTEKAGHYSKEVIAAARNFKGHSLLDFAKDSLTRAGINISGMDKMEIVARAFTSSTSDFPVLLEGTNRRVLLANYNAIADTWRRFCSTGSVSDFREYKRLRMGTFSDLESLTENEEYKNKKITDADYEKVSISTKGNIINVTRKMIINDDLSSFTRLAQMLGRAAARSIENDVYAFLASNPVLVDGKALFHADHNNIATDNGVATMARIDAMRQQMAIHKDKDQNDFLDIRPSIALAPLAIGSTLRTLNEASYDPDVTSKFQKPNIVRGLFNDVIDTPRLSGAPFYLLADPSIEPVFEVNFLNGEQNPYMESENGFSVDGVRWKIRLDYGVGAVGFRGIMKNAGA